MAQTHDIEDVLSSIRRLVANESGPTAKPRIPETDRNDGPALVLDDRHRVTEPEDPFQMIRMLAQEERDGRDAEHLTTALTEELAVITSDLAPPEDTRRFNEAPDTDEADVDREVEAERSAEPNGPDESHALDVPSEGDIPSDYVEDTDYEADHGESTEEHGDEVSTDVKGSFADREYDEEPNAGSAPEISAVDTPPHRPSPLADLSDAIDGDEALRDLIAEIVRQELAGELGERITRNVRKLVRREIRQMLASDEFD